jgi:hypothetical protein
LKLNNYYFGGIMEALRLKNKVVNRELKLVLPQSFDNSEVEVLILKLKKSKSNKDAMKKFLSHNLIIDKNIPYPDREERNAR